MVIYVNIINFKKPKKQLPYIDIFYIFIKKLLQKFFLSFIVDLQSFENIGDWGNDRKSYKRQVKRMSTNTAFVLKSDILLRDQFLRIGKAMIAFEDVLTLEDKHLDDRKKAYYNLKKAVYEFNRLRYRKTFKDLMFPTYPSHFFSYFCKSIDDYGVSGLREITSGRDESLIVQTNNAFHVNPYWRQILLEWEWYDSLESENILEIFKVISEMTDEGAAFTKEHFTRLRQTFSSKRTIPILSQEEFEQWIYEIDDCSHVEDEHHLTQYRNLVINLVDTIGFLKKEAQLCPHCNSILEDMIRCPSKHWHCEEEISRIKRMGKDFDVFDLEGRAYVRLTDWVTKYIRLSGLVEEYITKRTNQVIENITKQISVQNKQIKVVENPDFDRVDLVVNHERRCLIQGDVKDYKIAYQLAEKLNQQYKNRPEKWGNLDEIHIIIPRDTLQHASHNQYIDTVRGLVQQPLCINDPNKKLTIVSEEKWLDLVSNTINHLEIKGWNNESVCGA